MDEQKTDTQAEGTEVTDSATPTTDAAASTDVIIYSTPVCHFCQQAKEYFKENNVAYKEHDVASDAAKREEMIELTGQMGVPVIRIGNDIVIGFDEGKVKELLAGETAA